MENKKLINFLQETKSINFNSPLITEQIKLLQEKSTSNIDYIKNAYEFVRDEITHSWDVKADVVMNIRTDFEM